MTLPYDPTRQHGTNDLHRSDWTRVQPFGEGTPCHLCDNDDPYLDPPCPICGGTGIDARPKP